MSTPGPSQARGSHLVRWQRREGARHEPGRLPRFQRRTPASERPVRRLPALSALHAPPLQLLQYRQPLAFLDWLNPRRPAAGLSQPQRRWDTAWPLLGSRAGARARCCSPRSRQAPTRCLGNRQGERTFQLPGRPRPRPGSRPAPRQGRREPTAGPRARAWRHCCGVPTSSARALTWETLSVLSGDRASNRQAPQFAGSPGFQTPVSRPAAPTTAQVLQRFTRTPPTTRPPPAPACNWQTFGRVGARAFAAIAGPSETTALALAPPFPAVRVRRLLALRSASTAKPSRTAACTPPCTSPCAALAFARAWSAGFQ